MTWFGLQSTPLSRSSLHETDLRAFCLRRTNSLCKLKFWRRRSSISPCEPDILHSSACGGDESIAASQDVSTTVVVVSTFFDHFFLVGTSVTLPSIFLRGTLMLASLKDRLYSLPSRVGLNGDRDRDRARAFFFLPLYGIGISLPCIFPVFTGSCGGEPTNTSPADSLQNCGGDSVGWNLQAFIPCCTAGMSTPGKSVMMLLSISITVLS
mmetsp:Transcript_12880/g.29085  ORF Transcript_12880/g.29085 Transcript_12880/m.29085 type:complete len:210 (+) Transcript_12880:1433-2062(+)